METRSAADLQKAYKVTVVIGVVMIGTLFIYAGIVEFLKTQSSTFKEFGTAPDVVALLRYVLLGVAIVEFFAILYMKKAMLSAEAGVQQTSVVGPFGSEGQLVTAAIVTFALCESVAIYGLVLFLLGRSTTDFYLFLLISLFYFGIFFPRYGSWEEWMQGREQG
jgi:F0F1-type ATP synthase membrane subunit c/vacuolar-type H+-ATPase subunit K